MYQVQWNLQQNKIFSNTFSIKKKWFQSQHTNTKSGKVHVRKLSISLKHSHGILYTHTCKYYEPRSMTCNHTNKTTMTVTDKNKPYLTNNGYPPNSVAWTQLPNN